MAQTLRQRKIQQQIRRSAKLSNSVYHPNPEESAKPMRQNQRKTSETNHDSRTS